MSLNDSMSEVERSKLAVWDYPVSDKYTKIWQSMQVSFVLAAYPCMDYFNEEMHVLGCRTTPNI